MYSLFLKKMWVAIKQKCQPILISENNCYTYHTNSQFTLTSCTHSLRSFFGKWWFWKRRGWRVCSSPHLLESGAGIVSLWNRILCKGGINLPQESQCLLWLTDRLAEENGLLLRKKERIDTGEASPNWSSLGGKKQRLLY